MPFAATSPVTCWKRMTNSRLSRRPSSPIISAPFGIASNRSDSIKSKIDALTVGVAALGAMDGP